MDDINHLGSETLALIRLVLCFPKFLVFMAFDLEVGFSAHEFILPLEIHTAF